MPRPRSRIRYNSVAEVMPVRAASRVIPSVDPWMAAEMFVSPHVEERRRGFAILVGSEAARRSSLTPYLLASRIDEPELPLRAQVVQALADYFEIRGHEYRYPPEVRVAIAGYLRKFERPHVLALLDVHRAHGAGTVQLRPDSLSRLLERVPNASVHLTRIAGDKSVALEVRRAAIEVIGWVGFTDAAEVLTGLEARIEGRRAGQLTLTFAPSDHTEDQELLPALKETLRVLQDDE